MDGCPVFRVSLCAACEAGKCVLQEVVVQLAQLFSVSVTLSLTVNFHFCPLKPRKLKTASHEYVSTKTGSQSPGNLLYNILMMM